MKNIEDKTSYIDEINQMKRIENGSALSKIQKQIRIW